ncbi:LacI family DNA-binding transcriptional regulator [Aurantibacter sp.]|uniref:LacI family DNA-binding transcriptional regulator n=1 Tax=Aurantibacter sp. TaxID=2807103 RepID=UPI003266FFE0
MTEKKYTIKDIAKLAGVSKGTVDRVLHKRGRVSKEARDKVNQVIVEIDYQPNLIARNLKKNKVYRIYALIPDAKYDHYWLPTIKGIDEALKEFKPFGLVLEKFYFNPKDCNSFQKQTEQALSLKPDAILMAPVFHKESLDLFKLCKEHSIVVASFNNHIDKLGLENFIGQDLNQSGRVAAGLIDKITKKNCNIGILHINEESHMKHKEIGFRAYFKEKHKKPKEIVTFSLTNSEDLNFQDNISQFMSDNDGISAVFVTNSKAYLIANLLKNENKKIVIVGYDLLNENIELLKNGDIEFLIHQRPYRQAYVGVSYLAENLLFGKKIPSQNLLPIDIITAENVKYYEN